MIGETAIDGIIAIEAPGVIASFSAAAERMFGYQDEELIGRDFGLLIGRSSQVEIADHLARVLHAGNGVRVDLSSEVAGRRKDGTTFPMRLSFGELGRGDRGTLAAVVHDLTETKWAEERALQAERLAAMGQMMTVLTHESRNLLQICRANLDLLEMEVADRPDALDYVARIQTAHGRMSRLYHELREFAAPIQLDRQPYHLGKLFGQVLDELSAVHTERRIELREVADAIDLRCCVDPFRMHQVFRNLIENSITACADDPVQLRVAWSHLQIDDNPALEITLCDNGPGLTGEQKQKAFQPFFTTKKGGTGLGLAISRRIVEAHGGRITVGDAEESGAQFVITLPRENFS